VKAPEHDLDLGTEAARADSLAALGQAARASARFQRGLWWVLGLLASGSTAVMGWTGAKMDTRLEMQATLQLRVELQQWNRDRVRDHAELVTEIQSLRSSLLRQDLNDPGSVTRVEKGVWLAFRALAEHHAMVLAGETPRARAAKESAGDRFRSKFDSRAQGQLPQLAYAELVDQVAVP